MVESNSNIMLNLWKEGKTHVWKKKMEWRKDGNEKEGE